MIESKKNVPSIYRTSRDYKALLKLLDIVTCVNKNNNDNLVSLINPDRCPDKYLPLLASYVGYKYDYNLSYDTNRSIIKYYPELIRLRGSKDGIQLAAAVAINSSDSRYSIQSASNLIDINYDKDEGIIRVYIYFSGYLTKLNDLLDVVKPVGLNCVAVDSNAVRQSDQINVSDSFSSLLSNYDITSYRYRVTDYNNTGTIALDIPLKSGEKIDKGTLNIQLPIYMTYRYSYIKDDGSSETVTDNILKYITIQDDNGSLTCTGSEIFEVDIGRGKTVENAFIYAFNAGTVNYNTGRLELSLKTDTSHGIRKIISVIDATMNYGVNGKNRSSKLRNEIGFGQVDDTSSF